ncbi:MAG: hypothetical protein HYU30_00550 [Chloroflexi bacterium]|nr:hypothetical protein [Chloroflexota bacterium]
MKQLIHRLVVIENNLAKEKGPFWLFALVLPKSSQTGWDLIVAAPWLDSGIVGLEYVTNLLKSRLTDKEFRQIARVIIYDKFSATLKRAFREVPKQDGAQELRDTTFLGLPVTQGYVIAVGELEQAAAR